MPVPGQYRFCMAFFRSGENLVARIIRDLHDRCGAHEHSSGEQGSHERGGVLVNYVPLDSLIVTHSQEFLYNGL